MLHLLPLLVKFDDLHDDRELELYVHIADKDQFAVWTGSLVYFLTAIMIEGMMYPYLLFDNHD